MSAELEEIIVHTHAVEAQHIGPDAGERFLHRRSRRDVLTGLLGPAFGIRKLLPIDLAVPRQGQLIQQHERRRHHVLGQPRSQARAQSSRELLSQAAGQRIIRVVIPSRRRRLRRILNRACRNRLSGIPQQYLETLLLCRTAPANAHLIPEPIGDLPEALRIHRVRFRRAVGQLTTQVLHRAFLRALAYQSPRGSVPRDAPIRDPLDAQLRWACLRQLTGELFQRAVSRLPRAPWCLGWEAPGAGRGVQHHIVTEARQFIVRAGSLQLHVHERCAALRAHTLEELGVQHQLLLLRQHP